MRSSRFADIPGSASRRGDGPTVRSRPNAHEDFGDCHENRIAAQIQTTGEGGEDPRLLFKIPTGDSPTSAIKQVGPRAARRHQPNIWSSRGIADKQWRRAPAGPRAGPIAGNQGLSLDRNNSGTRTPGVGLISPPPHHDIYSFEDRGAAHPRSQNGNRPRSNSASSWSRRCVGPRVARRRGKAHADRRAFIIGGP